jgi:protein gp37
MAEDTKIQWCHHTFNPWRGCSKVHTGCKHCYAEVNYSVKMHGIKWGTQAQGGTRVKLADAGWQQPLTWDRQAQAAGERRRVFCSSLADVFEEWDGPVLDHVGNVIDGMTLAILRRDLFALIDATPWLDWLLLTKRPENAVRMWPDPSDDLRRLNYQRECQDLGYRSNVWIGTSISDQATADAMLPHLLKCRNLGKVLFVSAEPLVGPVDLINTIGQIGLRALGVQYAGKVTGLGGAPFVDWVIIGGESGPRARDCDLQWVRALAEQCRYSRIPVFVKQLGASQLSGGILVTGTRDPKGGDPAEWPADLRIREFPTR